MKPEHSCVGALGPIAAFALLILLPTEVQSQAATSTQGPDPPSAVVVTRTASSAWTPLQLKSPDGNYQVETIKDGRILYRRTSDRQVIWTLYACAPKAFVFSAAGRVLACAEPGNYGGKGHQPAVRIWFLEKRQWTEIRISGDELEALSVSDDRVAMCDRSEIRCFTLSDRKLVWSSPMPAGICDLKFSNDGAILMASFIDGSVRDYAARTGAWQR